MEISTQGAYGSDQISSVDYLEKDKTQRQTYNRAVSAFGIECPIIREGDDIVSIVLDSLDENGYHPNDADVIGITESVVARSLGKYVTIDQVAESVSQILCKNNCKIQPTVTVYMPIYSRNRFAMILKGIARAAYQIVFVMPNVDEVGNVSKNHMFTNVNYEQYYAQICKEEDCGIYPTIYTSDSDYALGYFHDKNMDSDLIIDCRMHPTSIEYLRSQGVKTPYITLFDICSEYSEWGVLGSNKSTEERLKLFPSTKDCDNICEKLKSEIWEKYGVDVIVCVYGDGCFKDPVAGIWEFADPVTMPGYTDGGLLLSTPNEIKMKALIDQNKDNNTVRKEMMKRDTGLGKMSSMGTTPRKRRDLLASLMDLVSGSGDRATPVVVVRNYF